MWNSSEAIPLAGLMTDEERLMITFISNVIVCFVLSVFGMLANIINIVVFVKMDANDSINITFISLAVADFLTLLTTFWLSVCSNPLILNSLSAPFRVMDFMLFPGSWLKIRFMRISALLTVLVTLERCLCIALPLKVHRIVTPRNTRCAVVFIYVFMLSFLAPLFYANQFVMKFYEDQNRSMVGLHYSSNRVEIESYIISINSVIAYISFFSVILFTVILAVTLKRKSQWRADVSSSKEAKDGVSSRDRRVSKMVVFVAAFFIVCNTPLTLGSAVLVIVPEFDFRGRFGNISGSFWSLAYIVETLSASVNIFIYYHMSGRFKEVFLRTRPMAWFIKTVEK